MMNVPSYRAWRLVKEIRAIQRERGITKPFPETEYTASDLVEAQRRVDG
jgi:hypothetical protein